MLFDWRPRCPNYLFACVWCFFYYSRPNFLYSVSSAACILIFLFGATSIVTAFLSEEGSVDFGDIFFFLFISPSFPFPLAPRCRFGSVRFGGLCRVCLLRRRNGREGVILCFCLTALARPAAYTLVCPGMFALSAFTINCSVYCHCAKVPRRERSRSALPRSFRDFLLRFSVFFRIFGYSLFLS